MGGIVKNSNNKLDFTAYKEATDSLKKQLKDIFMSEDSSIFVKYISGRVKSEESLKKKMAKDQLEYNKDNVEAHIFDVAGVRIVCLYKDDIYKIIDKITESGFKIKKYKDYLTNPKKSGYSGYHLILEYEVDGKVVNAEVQIRTLGMDLWSSLEHIIRYKKSYSLEKSIINDLDFFTHYENGLIDNSSYIISNMFDNLSNMINVSDDVLTNLSKKSIVDNDNNYNNNINVLDKSNYETALKILDNIMRNDISFIYNGKKIIEHKSGRLKNDKSIYSKLRRKYKGNIDNIDINSEMLNMSDIVGYRLVVPFLCDIDLAFNMLKDYSLRYPNVIWISDDMVEDYVKNPKDNGYSCYHVNGYVNVNYNDPSKMPKWIRVEIQIRTLAMDLWASYQRKLCFHKKETHYKELLYEFSEICREIDNEFSNYGKVVRGTKNNNDKVLKKVNNNFKI